MTTELLQGVVLGFSFGVGYRMGIEAIDRALTWRPRRAAKLAFRSRQLKCSQGPHPNDPTRWSIWKHAIDCSHPREDVEP